MVGVTGVGPVTSSLSGTRSNQLSYTPDWWRQPGSDRRLPACKAGALPAELCPRNRLTVTRSDGRVVARSSGPLDCRTDGPSDHRTLRHGGGPVSRPRGMRRTPKLQGGVAEPRVSRTPARGLGVRPRRRRRLMSWCRGVRRAPSRAGLRIPVANRGGAPSRGAAHRPGRPVARAACSLERR